jgi:hypothetical protein
MKRPNQDNSPESRERANVRLRRLTRSAILATAGATALIGVIVAKEHPGASSGDSATGTTPSQNPTTSVPTSTSNSSPPTTTTRRPVVTSGGTSR